MTDALLSVVSEAQRKAFPTLSVLTENDVENIWSNVSSFIERQMSSQKGVRVSGLGTFTFSRQKIDLGSKVILIQRPIFLLSEKLALAHGLKQTKALPAGEIPVVPLNFAALSVEGPFEREQLEGCVTETLLLLRRAVALRRRVLFSFHNIGLLLVQHPRVRMKFYRDFVTAVDGTGTVILALCNRLGTSTSLVTVNMSPEQRQTSHQALLLPSNPTVEQSKKVEGRGESAGETGGPPPSPGETGGPPAGPDAPEDCGRVTQSPRRPGTRQTLQPAKVNGVCLTSELEVPPPATPVTPAGRARGFPRPLGEERREEERREEERKREKEGEEEHNCDEGQELCVLCRRRAQRNEAVCVGSEERERQEVEQESILMYGEQLRCQQYLLKEQLRQQQLRESSQKVAAFNLGVAEATKERAAARPTRFYGSYIYPARPPTPAPLPRQRRYLHDLLEQAESQRRRHDDARRAQELDQRLRQAQLADEITELKEQQRQRREEKIRSYQSALDSQLQEPNRQLPGRQPDSEGPLFGLCDRLPRGLAEQRRRARGLYLHQLHSATQRREEALRLRAAGQRAEMDVITRTNRETIADRLLHHDRQRRMRAGLEETWGRSLESKRAREQEERKFCRAGCGLLLDQGSGARRRCARCQRSSSCCGGTNVWKETHYAAGSRLML